MFVDKYMKEKNFAKAAEYAQLALKALEQAKKSGRDQRGRVAEVCEGHAGVPPTTSSE